MDAAATEGAKNAVFSVTLSTSSVGSVEVGYATFDGTAVAGADYQATSGTLVFPAGERARTVSVPLTVADDTIDQEPRTFFLTLSGPTGATVADGQATATILDDDMRTLSIDSPRVTEGGTAVFTVSLDAPSVRTITVDFTTVPGTATPDVDYQTTAGTLTFPPGALTQSIVVPVSANPRTHSTSCC